MTTRSSRADTASPRSRPTTRVLGGGVPDVIKGETVIVLPYRDPAAYDLIREHKDNLAMVLIEPVQSSNPRLDTGDFLHGLLDVCRESNVLFLMDEVITGFRIQYGGCQQHYDITPDLATFGKAIGGGQPIGAVGGRGDVMNGFTGKDDAPFIFLWRNVLREPVDHGRRHCSGGLHAGAQGDALPLPE